MDAVKGKDAEGVIGLSDQTPDQTNKLTYLVENPLTKISSKEVKKLFVFGLPSKLTLSSVASMAWMPSRGRMLKDLSAKVIEPQIKQTN